MCELQENGQSCMIIERAKQIKPDTLREQTLGQVVTLLEQNECRATVNMCGNTCLNPIGYTVLKVVEAVEASVAASQQPPEEPPIMYACGP